MTGLEPNSTLLFEALAPSGCVIPTEQRTAMELSLALKKEEALLHNLYLWGRITTTSGKDYLVAQSTHRAYHFKGEYVLERKNYFSQDGVKWMDLQPISEEKHLKSQQISGGMTGDPSHVYAVVEEPEPKEGEDVAPPPLADQEGQEGETAPEEDGEAPPEPDLPKYPVNELERLASLIRAVDSECGVTPLGSVLLNAHNDLIFEKSFGGLKYPDKLESYVHLASGPTEAPLSMDIPGLWSMHFDNFAGLATLHSLMWPGYHFYYSRKTNTFGSLYFGNGERNLDIAFMI